MSSAYSVTPTGTQIKDSIFIRRSEKKWRKQLYRVKPGQIIKVVKTILPQPTSVDDSDFPKIDDSDFPKDSERSTTPPQRNQRLSKNKARLWIAIKKFRAVL